MGIRDDEDRDERIARIRDADDGQAFKHDVRCVHETDDALRIAWGLVSQQWVPKSQIHPSSKVQRKGDKGELVVYTYFAEKLCSWWETAE